METLLRLKATAMSQVLALLFVPTIKLNKMSLSNFLWIVYYASVCSVLLPITAYFLARKKNRMRNIVFILLLASLAADLGNWIYAYLGHRSYLLINIFFVGQIMLLCLVYLKMISNKKVVKIALWTFPLVVLAYTAFQSFNHSFSQSISEYQSPIRVVGGILMIAFAFRYFWQMYCYLPADDLSKFLKGWINIAVFSYFSFNLFLFFCANYFFHHESNVVAMAFWSFHNLNNIAKNGLLAFGLYLSTEEYPNDPDIE
jgi:hypothetical protein